MGNLISTHTLKDHVIELIKNVCIWCLVIMMIRKSPTNIFEVVKILGNLDNFKFQNYLKNTDPPLGSNSDILEFENILMVEDPPD